MKKLTYFRPSLITNELFKGYKDPAVINTGKCFIWAYSAFVIFEGIELWDVDIHAFVKYRGKFYDSETLRGSPDWQDLPATEGASIPARSYTPLGFKRMWAGNPQRFNTSWRSIEAKAKRILTRETSLRLRCA